MKQVHRHLHISLGLRALAIGLAGRHQFHGGLHQPHHIRQVNRCHYNRVNQDPDNSGSIDGGDVNIWNFSLGGIWSLGQKNKGFYLTGSVGLYYLDYRLTTNGLVYYPPVCAPWFWWCVPGGVGQGSIVKSSGDATEFGWDAGMGYSYPLEETQVYVEATYHTVYTHSRNTTYIPVVLGVRF